MGLFAGFETDRLLIQHWDDDLRSPETREALKGQLRDLLSPAVMAPLPPSLQIDDTDRALDDWIVARRDESTVFLVRNRQDHSLLGLLILAQFGDEGGQISFHIGYLLGAEHWGRGYASELISGLVDATTGLGRSITLLGGVAPDNPASARVLTKNGFTLAPGHPETDNIMYELRVGP